MSPLPTISVVTPWMNHLELAEDYWKALEGEVGPGDEVLVVDNASDPPLAFASIRSEVNLGFSGGCNLGLRAAQGDAVLFLNNDIALGKAGWLQVIREALEPGVLVGEIRDGPHTAVNGKRYPYLDGWCLAGMKEELLELGGWDETLQEPSYYSDNVLCLEARAAGFTLKEVRVALRHKENATAGRYTEPSVVAATETNRAHYLALVAGLDPINQRST